MVERLEQTIWGQHLKGLQGLFRRVITPTDTDLSREVLLQLLPAFSASTDPI